MEREIICLDSSVLIDYYRKVDKSKSFLFKLTQQYSSFAVSVITQYELLVGSNDGQDVFWHQFFDRVTVLPYDSLVNSEAIRIYRSLKQKSKLIDIPDLFIGATAKVHNMKLATLNEKHFERIDGLRLLLKS